jgi:hypothetical protein
VIGQAIHGRPVFFFQGAAPLDGLCSAGRFAFERVAEGKSDSVKRNEESLPVVTDSTSSSNSAFSSRPLLEV